VRRILTKPIMIGVVVILLVAGYFAFKEVRFQLKRSAMVERWKQEIIADLTSSDQYDDIQPLITQLGTMLGTSESNWIAIEYRDTHNIQIDNIAIARMRDGRLFESHRHHCGSFAGYLNAKEEMEMTQPMMPEYKGMTLREYWVATGQENYLFYLDIAETIDPEEQVLLLSKLGFEPVE
jgi:hypothetical protein